MPAFYTPLYHTKITCSDCLCRKREESLVYRSTPVVVSVLFLEPPVRMHKLHIHQAKPWRHPAVGRTKRAGGRGRRWTTNDNSGQESKCWSGIHRERRCLHICSLATGSTLAVRMRDRYLFQRDAGEDFYQSLLPLLLLLLLFWYHLSSSWLLSYLTWLKQCCNYPLEVHAIQSDD